MVRGRTPFVETDILLDVMDGKQDWAMDKIEAMLVGELATYWHQLETTMDLVAQEINRRSIRGS